MAAQIKGNDDESQRVEIKNMSPEALSFFLSSLFSTTQQKQALIEVTRYRRSSTTVLPATITFKRQRMESTERQVTDPHESRARCLRTCVRPCQFTHTHTHLWLVLLQHEDAVGDVQERA